MHTTHLYTAILGHNVAAQMICATGAWNALWEFCGELWNNLLLKPDWETFHWRNRKISASLWVWADDIGCKCIWALFKFETTLNKEDYQFLSHVYTFNTFLFIVWKLHTAKPMQKPWDWHWTECRPVLELTFCKTPAHFVTAVTSIKLLDTGSKEKYTSFWSNTCILSMLNNFIKGCLIELSTCLGYNLGM